MCTQTSLHKESYQLIDGEQKKQMQQNEGKTKSNNTKVINSN